MTVPLVIRAKVLQGRGCERTVPLSKGAKVLQGAAAARRDAPHLVPKTVTGCGLPSAQCTRPSLRQEARTSFTIRRGRRAAALTYDGEVLQPFTMPRKPLHPFTSNGQVSQGRDRRSWGAPTCAKTLLLVEVRREIHLRVCFRGAICCVTRNRNVTIDSGKTLLHAPAVGRVAESGPALSQGGQNCDGVAAVRRARPLAMPPKPLHPLTIRGKV